MTSHTELQARFCVLGSRLGTLQVGQNFSPNLIFARRHRVVYTSVGHRPSNDLLSFVRTHGTIQDRIAVGIMLYLLYFSIIHRCANRYIATSVSRKYGTSTAAPA